VFVQAQQATAQAPAPLPRLIKVADDLYVIQNINHTVAEIGQNGGNVTVIVTREGVILVDAKNERMHDDIVAKVKSVTDRPIRYMVLTHNHGDHSGGSARLQATGVTVVSSIASRENMARSNAPGRAHIAYAGYSEIEVGGTRLELREFRGHTKGDTVVALPAFRTVIAGDLVATPDTIPVIVNYADGGNWTELVESLDAIDKMEFDVLIAGHGPNLTKVEFRKYRDKAEAIRDRFRTLNREKKTQDEIARILAAEFNWGTGPAAGNLAGMMQELR
jgi:glyoxylase-like metal-dependent hydrolase (beta-lactamase superfamily II)